jgi:hypothetical protein
VAELGFERDILPLFRPADIDAMSFVFDLGSYEDVRANANEIYARLADGTMPCDVSWPEADVERFRRWMETGACP